MKGDEPRNELIEIAKKLYNDVKVGLETKKTLGWELSVSALNAAIRTWKYRETQEFLEVFLFNMIEILSNQSSKTAFANEKRCVEDSMLCALELVCKGLAESNTRYVPVLTRILPHALPFYDGVRVNFVQYPGYPASRLIMVKKFAELEGHRLLLAAMLQPEHQQDAWLTVTNLYTFVKAMVESQHLVPNQVSEALSAEVKRRLLDMSEDSLKRENLDHVTLLVKVLGRADTIRHDQPERSRRLHAHHLFWEDLTLKFLRCQSLVLRLFGWDLVHELLKESRATRPLCDAFLVIGSGCEDCNGTYTMTSRGPDGVVTYVKQPSRSNMPLLTLFRCPIRNSKSRWWYISEVDPENPGTEKDIDYYQHKTPLSLDREPPHAGWLTVRNPPMGRDPPPRLVRSGNLLLDEIPLELYLFSHLPSWIAENDILGSVFSSSPHREIVSRSAKLVSYLADAGVLTVQQLNLIWKAAVSSNDPDIIEEIFTILVSVSSTVSDELFLAILDQGLQTLRSSETAIVKISQFIETYAKESTPSDGVRSADCPAKLLELVWTLYKSPQFESLKNAAVIQDFLSQCLSQPSGRDIALQSVRECMDLLSSAAAGAVGADETLLARVIQTLKFLISNNYSEAWVRSLEQINLQTCLVTEIKRFVVAQRSRAGSDTSANAGELLSRLNLLRQFYSMHQSVRISTAVVAELWSLLSSSSSELTCLFSMFSLGLGQRGHDHCFADARTLTIIFTDFICREDVDWSSLGADSFHCFQAYYKMLDNIISDAERLSGLTLSVQDRPPRLGLNTLWNIVFSLGDSDAQKLSQILLIQSYQEIHIEDTNAHLEFVQRIFSRLEQISDGESLSRCVDVLLTSIVTSKESSRPAHAVRGCMDKVKIIVHHKRVQSIFNSITQSRIFRVEKGSETSYSIEVHPLHSILQLKEKIAFVTNQSSVTNIVIEGAEKLSDTSRLVELKLVDGADWYASTQVMYPKPVLEESRGQSNEFLLPSLGQVISDNKSYFNTLIGLVETTPSLQLKQKIWQVLMLIPTQEDYLAEIGAEQSCEEVDPKWSKIFLEESMSFRAYMLQIVDFCLQPTKDSLDDLSLSQADRFKSYFLSTGGFEAVLNFFKSTSPESSFIAPGALFVALHTIHFLLFQHCGFEEGEEETSGTLIANEDLLALIQAQPSSVIDKLLAVAGSAAAAEATNVVHDALVTLNYLLQCADHSSLLFVGNQASRSLLVTVLRSGSQLVRQMASDFAIKVGQSEPVVFQWLLAELKGLDDDDVLCGDTIRAMAGLMDDLYAKHTESVDWVDLATLLTSKLKLYAESSRRNLGDNKVLIGHLLLLEKLIRIDFQAISFSHIDFVDLTNMFLETYLFCLPSGGLDLGPICDSSHSKDAVFGVLSAFSSVSAESNQLLLARISSLSRSASSAVISQKRSDRYTFDNGEKVNFRGLRNQGCTCYMNSLLQQLFMNVSFREAILSVPLLECHRSTISHRTDEELVGLTLLFEIGTGTWKSGRVLSFNSEKSLHEVQFDTEIVSLSIHKRSSEKNSIRIAPPEGLVVSEREEGAYRVLEQLQRCFVFMKFSKGQAFDPKPFVEACKTLNMNFNVYHQNDASEFCDQLLDRIELATKGKHTSRDHWSNVMLKSVFGGKFLYQKIPQDCEAYKADKKECGHWQSSRNESFLKVELIIRGKDNIHDSISELVTGELMDGDNKIDCEVCTQKKATVRRTCFDTLPNVLILHLKRFDLDFTTFETVKLNNRMAFDPRINLLRYTKEGIEAEERRLARSARTGAEDVEGLEGDVDKISYEHTATDDWTEPNPEDFEYELQGVLVHAGVAQGGHYYSFAKDYSGSDWFKFDDEDVSPFSADQIPTQCFGGPISGAAGGDDEKDRTSNALMLFYKKVKPQVIDTDAADHAVADSVSGMRLVTGTQAFQKEVDDWNRQYLLSKYALDPSLQAFTRNLLLSIASTEKFHRTNVKSGHIMRWYSADQDSALSLEAVKFGFYFLFDTILRSRECSLPREWVETSRRMFEAFKHTAIWFLQELFFGAGKWFDYFSLYCVDSFARTTFVQIVSQTVSLIAPPGVEQANAFDRFVEQPLESLIEISRKKVSSGDRIGTVSAALLVLLCHQVLDKVLDAPAFVRNSDEVFLLIREIAVIPCMAKVLLQLRAVSKLAYFVAPDIVTEDIRNSFVLRIQHHKVTTRSDTFPLFQSIYEALAALLGVPQVRKVQILQERSMQGATLVPEAVDALTKIFSEVSTKGGMTANDIIEYKEKTGAKVSLTVAMHVLDLFHKNADGQLSLTGFLQYYTDLAGYNIKELWKDLHAFGFRNDLSRGSASGASSATSSVCLPPTFAPLSIPNLCKKIMFNIKVYVVGMEVSEACAKAIAMRACMGDLLVSQLIIKAILDRIAILSPAWSWDAPLSNMLGLIRAILSIGDDSQEKRIREVLLNPSKGFCPIIESQSREPLNCRANDYDRFNLMKRYVKFVEEICFESRVKQVFDSFVETEAKVKFTRGHMRATPDSIFTMNEELLLHKTVVRVSAAGSAEVNGDYFFKRVTTFGHPVFCRPGVFEGSAVTFSLYKFYLKSADYQWFITIAPEGASPGSNMDIDFYYVQIRSGDSLLPPMRGWNLASGGSHCRLPPPVITIFSSGSAPPTAPLPPVPHTIHPPSSQPPHERWQDRQIDPADEDDDEFNANTYYNNQD